MAKSMTMFFGLCLMIVLVSGCASTTERPSIFGTWTSSAATYDSLAMTNLVLTINEDTDRTYSFSYDAGGGANTETGVMFPLDPPENWSITFTVFTSSGPAAPSALAQWNMRYTNLTVDSVDLEMDLPVNDGFGDPAVTFARQ